MASLGLAAGVWAQKLADKKALTLAAAKQIAAASEAEAAKNKFTMVIAVVDDGGNATVAQAGVDALTKILTQ